MVSERNGKYGGHAPCVILNIADCPPLIDQELSGMFVVFVLTANPGVTTTFQF